jgi:hypothetical protein
MMLEQLKAARRPAVLSKFERKQLRRVYQGSSSSAPRH